MADINFLNMFFIFLVSAAGAAIQATTGFGMAIILMLVLPIFFGVPSAAALCSVICITQNIGLVIKYRKYISWKDVWLPTVIYTAVNAICIYVLTMIDVSGLKAWIGVFLVLAAIYFIFFSERIKLKVCTASAIISSGLAGISGGFFGIGGPFVVPYVLAAANDEKLVYLGTIQVIFVFQNIVSIVFRAVNGFFGTQVLWGIIPGLLGSVLGTWLGTLIVNRINIKQMKLFIYVFLGISGVITFITNISLI